MTEQDLKVIRGVVEAWDWAKTMYDDDAADAELLIRDFKEHGGIEPLRSLMGGGKNTQLVQSEEIDKRLGWPLGRAERLARQRRLPYTLLPDGTIRFVWEEVEALLVRVSAVEVVGPIEVKRANP